MKGSAAKSPAKKETFKATKKTPPIWCVVTIPSKDFLERLLTLWFKSERSCVSFSVAKAMVLAEVLASFKSAANSGFFCFVASVEAVSG